MFAKHIILLFYTFISRGYSDVHSVEISDDFSSAYRRICVIRAIGQLAETRFKRSTRGRNIIRPNGFFFRTVLAHSILYFIFVCTAAPPYRFWNAISSLFYIRECAQDRFYFIVIVLCAYNVYYMAVMSADRFQKIYCYQTTGRLLIFSNRRARYCT